MSNECKLLSNGFPLLVQVCLGIICLGVLFYKRYKETPTRPIKIWALDTTKQGISALVGHFISMLYSIIFTSKNGNECSMYLLVFIIVLFITVYEDLLIAIAVGVVFAFLCSIKQLKSIIKSKNRHKIIPLSESDSIIEKDRKKIKKIPVRCLQPIGPIFFASIESLMNLYSNAPKHKMLIIDMSYVTMIDLSGAFAIEDLIKNVKSKNIKVIVSNVTNDVESVLKKIGFFKHIGEKHYINSNDKLIATILEEEFV